MGSSFSIPYWLHKLEKKHFLTSYQHQFVTDICANIMQGKDESGENLPPGRVDQIKSIAENLTNDLETVIDMLDKYHTSKQHFRRIYDDWKNVRKSNIEQLRIIAQVIDDKKRNAQESTLIDAFGALAVAATGLMTVGAVTLSADFFTGLIRGAAVAGAGAIITAFHLCKDIFFRIKIEKSLEIMKRDKEHTETLIKWLYDANSLHKTGNETQFTRFTGDFAMTAKYLKEVSKRYSATGDDITQELELLNVPPELKEEVCNIVGILISFYMLRDNYNSYFFEARKCVTVMQKLSVSFDLVKFLSTGHSTKSSYDFKSFPKKAINNEILQDVTNMLYISAQDPKTMDAEKIRIVANQMEKEDNILSKLICCPQCIPNNAHGTE